MFRIVYGCSSSKLKRSRLKIKVDSLCKSFFLVLWFKYEYQIFTLYTLTTKSCINLKGVSEEVHKDLVNRKYSYGGI